MFDERGQSIGHGNDSNNDNEMKNIIEIKGGDSIAASLGTAFGRPGMVRAQVSGELSEVAACVKRGTVRLGLESLVSVLLTSGAVSRAALRIALSDSVRHDAGQDVTKAETAKALLAEVKAEIEKSIPPVTQAASWRLKNGIMVPAE